MLFLAQSKPSIVLILIHIDFVSIEPLFLIHKGNFHQNLKTEASCGPEVVSDKETWGVQTVLEAT